MSIVIRPAEGFFSKKKKSEDAAAPKPNPELEAETLKYEANLKEYEQLKKRRDKILAEREKLQSQHKRIREQLEKQSGKSEACPPCRIEDLSKEIRTIESELEKIPAPKRRASAAEADRKWLDDLNSGLSDMKAKNQSVQILLDKLRLVTDELNNEYKEEIEDMKSQLQKPCGPCPAHLVKSIEQQRNALKNELSKRRGSM